MYLHVEFGEEVNAHFSTLGSSILTHQVTDIPTSNKYTGTTNKKNSVLTAKELKRLREEASLH